MPYEVQTPVFEGPFDLLLHLILREQVDLYEVSLADDRRRLPRRARARWRQLDLDVATEFLLIAATLVELKARRLLPGRRRRRPRRRAGPVGGARPAPGPPARVQDVQGRRRACSPALADGAGRSLPPGRRARRALPRPGARPARGRRPPTTCARPFLRAVAPRPVPAVDLDHVAPIRVSVADAVEELVDELPRGRAHHVPASSPARWSSGSRWSCASSPCSSCSSRAWSTSTRPAPSATSRSCWLGAGERRRRRSSTLAVASTVVDRRATRADRDRDEAHRAIEAIVMVAEEPGRAAACWPSCSSSPRRRSRSCCAELAAELRGRASAASSWCGWPAATATRAIPTWPPTSSGSCSRARAARLSAAALETLAIVAYKQPISRAQVAAIRGVNVDGVMRTLAAARLHRRGRPVTPGPARPCCSARRRCSSSGSGLDSLDDLPPLAEFVPGADVVEALEQGLRVDPSTTLAGPIDDRRRGRTAPSDRAERRPEPDAWLLERRAAAPEGPGPGRLRQPAGLRGPDRRGPGHGQRRGRRARPAGRRRARPGRGRRGARRRRPRASSTTCSTSRRAW